MPQSTQHTRYKYSTNSFTVSTDEAAADESGEKVPDYAVLSNTTQKCNISASAEEMDKALVKILKWTEGNYPAERRCTFVLTLTSLRAQAV